MSETWVAHVCTHEACDKVVIAGSQNLSQYLCYRLDRHAAPQPLRPVILGIIEKPSGPYAEALREEESGGLWRRPSQHFAFDVEHGCELLTEPLSDEDWPGWPEIAPARSQA